jgi:hypothetical protein
MPQALCWSSYSHQLILPRCSSSEGRQQNDDWRSSSIGELGHEKHLTAVHGDLPIQDSRKLLHGPEETLKLRAEDAELFVHVPDLKRFPMGTGM